MNRRYFCRELPEVYFPAVGITKIKNKNGGNDDSTDY